MMKNLPDRLTDIFDRLTLLNLPVIQSLHEGLTELELQYLLRDFPFQLPLEVKRYFQWRSAVAEGYLNSLLFPRGYIHSLHQALEVRLTYLEVQGEGIIDQDPSMVRLTTISNRYALEKDGLLWDLRWLSLFSYEGAEEWFIICDEKQQATSPVYFYCVSASDEFYLAYDSLTALLLSTVEAYETGAYYIDGGNLYQKRAEVNFIINRYNPQRMAYHLNAVGVNTFEEIIPLLIQTLLDGDYFYYAKIECAFLLLGTASALLSLINYLYHEDESVRAVVAGLLGELGDQRAVEPLTTLLRNDPAETVCIAAAKALGNLRNGKVVDMLLSA